MTSPYVQYPATASILGLSRAALEEMPDKDAALPGQEKRVRRTKEGFPTFLRAGLVGVDGELDK